MPHRVLADARLRIVRLKKKIASEVEKIEALNDPESRCTDPEQEEYDFANVFCAVCRNKDGDSDKEDEGGDRDTVVCDGSCGRAFHLGCHVPPITMEDLGEEDDPWLCAECTVRGGLVVLSLHLIVSCRTHSLTHSLTH